MLLLALAVALIPLLLLTKYAIPFFDDYGYSAPVWIHYMLGGFNPKGVISGSIENAVNMWHTWQGTYSSIFFMGLNPMIFGEQYYIIGPVFLILNLVLSMFVFTFVSCKVYLKKSGLPKNPACPCLACLPELLCLLSFSCTLPSKGYTGLTVVSIMSECFRLSYIFSRF